MENDCRGKIGEIIVSNSLHKFSDLFFNLDISDINKHEDGIYDLKINNKRIEVKTSCHTADFCWQHEPLYKENKCDIIIFIDFTYNSFYISYCLDEELPLGKDNELLFGKKHGTLRKNKDDGYKLDFSRATIKKLIENNRCKEFSDKTNYDEIANFLRGVFDLK